jgi:hypothetical protein
VVKVWRRRKPPDTPSLEDEAMRRALLTAITAASVLYAVPAQAQGWRWLEKLSGPGDFTGYEVSVKLWCKYDEVNLKTRAVIPGISMPCVFKAKADDSPENDPKDLRSSDAIVGKRVLNLTQRVYALGASVSYLRGRSDLIYLPTITHVDRTVQVWAFEGFFDHRMTSRIDSGVAVGANVFVVPASDNFARWSIEPRVTFKLFDLRKDDLYAGSATVRVGLLAFFKEFNAEDFGAIPGTYRSGAEVGPSIRFVLDFDRNPFGSK